MLNATGGLPRDMYLTLAGNDPETFGFMVRSVERSSAAEYAPRFGTGKSDETDLSLLKAETYSFTGGMFQRREKENDRNSILYGDYNGYDDTLYAYPNGTLITADYIGTPTAECFGGNTTFIATRIGSTNKIAKVISTGAITWLTLPAAVSGASVSITSMVVLGDYLFVCGQTYGIGTFNVHRMTISTSAWQDVGGGLQSLAVLRGKLYGVNYLGSVWLAPDPNVATVAWQMVYAAPGGIATPVAWFEFNGALWLSYQGETYRFDGVNMVNVLNHECKYAEVYNGAVYYMVDKWLYRFNGSVVEKMQFFDETIVGLRADHRDLFIVTNSPLSKYSEYESAKNPTDTLMGRLYYFNGTAFYEAYESYTSNPESGFSSWPAGLARHAAGILLLGANSGSGYGYVRRHSRDEVQAKYIAIYSSEIDNGFPNNWKSLQYIDLNADGWSASSENVYVQIQIHDGATWTDWVTVGTLFNGYTRVTIPLTEDYLYKMLRVRIYAAPGSASQLSIRSYTLRYTLQPRQRSNFRVDFVLPTDDAAGVKDRRNNKIDEVYASKSNYMYYLSSLSRALHSKLPVFLIGTDWAKADNPGITTGVGYVYLGGTFPFYPYPNRNDERAYIALTNDDGVTWEIAKVATVGYSLTAGKASTSVEISSRSVVGSAISINANTKFATCIQVYCSRLITERIVANGSTIQRTFDGTTDPIFSENERVVSLEFVEV